MSSLTPQQIDELEQIAKAATPGEWTNGMRGSGSSGDAHMCRVLARDKETRSGLQVALTWDAMAVVSYVGFSRQQCIDNAEHIAAFDPPTVLALLSEVRALRESVKAYREWREAFIDYGLAELTESGPTLQQAERLAKAEPELPSSTAKEPA